MLDPIRCIHDPVVYIGVPRQFSVHAYMPLLDDDSILIFRNQMLGASVFLLYLSTSHYLVYDHKQT